MHRDLKVGLALAVLLIGVAAAFSFRLEPVKLAGEPQLKNARKLDESIAEKPVGPYLTGAATKSQNSQTTPSMQPASKQTPNPKQPSWNLPDFLKEEFGITYEAQTNRPNQSSAGSALSGNTASVTKNAKTQDQTPQRPPNHNLAWTPKAISETPTPSDSSAQESLITHRVSEGETLSELAQQFLGNSARFMEIYAENRHVLKNPDDLQSGLLLKIPSVERKPPDFSASRAKAASQPQEVSPVRRPNANSATNDGEGLRSSGKALVQTPPENLPHVTGLRGWKTKPETAAARRYQVLRGDTLEGLALRFYGTRRGVGTLLDANRHQLRTPRDLWAGMTLLIPPPATQSSSTE